MAKYIITYENGTIKKELTFRNEIYSYTMQAYVNGVRKADDKGFDYQFEERYPNDSRVDEIAGIMESISFGGDDDIEEALEELEDYE